MSQKSDRVDAAVRVWKARLQREPVPRGTRTTPVITTANDEFERAARRLEQEFAEVRSNRAIVARRLADVEKRATNAMREGHDATARRLSMAQRECAETLRQLDADAKVLGAMLAECEAGLTEVKARTP